MFLQVVDVPQTSSLSSAVICDPQLVFHLLYPLSDVDVLQTYSLYSSLVVDVFQTYSLSSAVICDPQLVIHLLYHLSDVDVLQTYSLYSSLVVDVFLDLQSFYTVVNLFICCIIYCIIQLYHLLYHLVVSSIVSSSCYQTFFITISNLQYTDNYI